MNVQIIGVPFQGDVARWGGAKAAQGFLDAGLIAALEARGHTVSGPIWIELPREERSRDTVSNLGRIAARTGQAVATALRQPNTLPLVLAGDCTHSVGPVGGLARAGETPGLVWFDAHGDMNTMQTTTSGMLGGMPFAVMLGWEFNDWRLAAGLGEPVRPEAAALIGASDLDDGEIAALNAHPIARIDADAMQDAATGDRVRQALAARANAATAWAIHVDLDVAGPEELPSGNTPAPHWPPRERFIDAVRAAAAAVPVRVVTVAVYNPAYDPDQRGGRLGVDVALAALDGIAG